MSVSSLDRSATTAPVFFISFEYHLKSELKSPIFKCLDHLKTAILKLVGLSNGKISLDPLKKVSLYVCRKMPMLKADLCFNTLYTNDIIFVKQ
jgi:hypothetical protein